MIPTTVAYHEEDTLSTLPITLTLVVWLVSPVVADGSSPLSFAADLQAQQCTAAALSHSGINETKEKGIMKKQAKVYSQSGTFHWLICILNTNSTKLGSQ